MRNFELRNLSRPVEMKAAEREWTGGGESDLLDG